MADNIKKLLFAFFQVDLNARFILEKVTPENLEKIASALQKLENEYFSKTRNSNGEVVSNYAGDRPYAFIIHKGNSETIVRNSQRGQPSTADLNQAKQEMIDYILSGKELNGAFGKGSEKLDGGESRTVLHFGPAEEEQTKETASQSPVENEGVAQPSETDKAASADDIKKVLFGLFQQDTSLEDILRKVNPEKLIEIQNNLNEMTNSLFKNSFEENRPIGFKIYKAENDIRSIDNAIQDEIITPELADAKKTMINYILSGRPLDVFTLENRFLHFNPHRVKRPSTEQQDLSASVLKQPEVDVAGPENAPAEGTLPPEGAQIIEIDGEEYVLPEKDRELLAKKALSEEDKRSIDAMVVTMKPNSYWDMVRNGASAVLSAPGAVAGAVGTGISAVTGMVGNIASAVTSGVAKGVEAAGTVISEVQSARKNFREGIDFWSMFQSGYAKGVDFWNADSAQYDPMLANVINAFGKQFAKDLHFLLKNSTVLGAPKFGVKLATKLDLGVKGTSLAIDKFLSLSNPLGWVNTAFMLSDLGVELGALFHNGILGEVNAYIDEFVIEKLEEKDLNRGQIEYLILKGEMDKIKSKLRIEEQKFQQQLIAQGITKAKPKESTYNPIVYASNRLREIEWWKDYEDQAPASYQELENELAEAKRALNKFSEDHEVNMADITGSQIVESIKWTEIGFGLKSSCKKTLESLTTSLEASLENKQPQLGGEEEPQESSLIRGLGRNVLRNMILGGADEYNARLRNYAGQVGNLNQAAKIIKGAATSPVQFAYSRMPKEVQQGVRNFFQPVTSAVGEGIANFVFAPNAVELIEQLQLQAPKDLFTRDQLALNLSKRMGGTQYSELLEAVDGFIDFDDILRRCLNSAGERMADRFALKLAEVLLKKTKNNQYTPEHIISTEIPLTAKQKAARQLGKAAGNLMGGVVQMGKNAAQLASNISSAFNKPSPPNEGQS
jgi:hypothetical protein